MSVDNNISKVVLAPMAGITDRPFRILCRSFGADATTSEMVSANPALRNTSKSKNRLNYQGESGLRIVQIAGSDPATMADAARFNVDNGAEVIDINMGCPAKKVCNVMAGSALLKDEILVGKILESVVNAVDVPVSVKIRTGTDLEHRNGVTIAQIAEQSGIRSIAVHGRTRACAYRGDAEYETIHLIKQAIKIPLYANGDITNPQKAKHVLEVTGADGIMIGRAAQGSPWIFNQIKQFLDTEELIAAPSLIEIEQIMLGHLNSLYEFYGEFQGIRIARKHIRWYLDKLPSEYALESKNVWRQISRVDNIDTQLELIIKFFETLAINAKAA